MGNNPGRPHCITIMKLSRPAEMRDGQQLKRVCVDWAAQPVVISNVSEVISVMLLQIIGLVWALGFV